MKFKSIDIKNFRNFKGAFVNLDNRNVFFGMNDAGKTNLLWAMRFIFDYNIRKNGFQQSDFYDLNIEEKIEISVVLDLSDFDNNDDTKKIISYAGKSMSSDENNLIIRLTSKYNAEQKGYVCVIEWGYDDNHMEQVRSSGIITDVDKVFKVNYIDPTIDLDNIFKKHFISLLNREGDNQDDFKDKLTALNNTIKNLTSINNISLALNDEFKKYNTNTVKLAFSSDNINLDPYKTIAPFMLKENSDNPFPLSGDGQRKLASYSILKYKTIKDNTRYINLFLVEEPENHLHQTSLAKLSQVLFNYSEFPYLFITTHSDELLLDMDNINLIRIFNLGTLKTLNTIYKVPEEYIKVKKMLNSSLAKALFYNRVLLVEGVSELVFFDLILSENNYQSRGYLILPVNGIAFKEYLKILVPLGIDVLIKTDNDIRVNKNGKKELLGLNRVKDLAKLYATLKNNTQLLTEIDALNMTTNIQASFKNKVSYKKALYSANQNNLDTIKNNSQIFLSKSDLENDLHEVIDRIDVDELQKKKLYNMVKLLPTFTTAEIATVKEHENFKCLEVFLNGNE